MIKEQLYSLIQTTEEYLKVIELKKKEVKGKVRELTKLLATNEKYGYTPQELVEELRTREIELDEVIKEEKAHKKGLSAMNKALGFMNGDEQDEVEEVVNPVDGETV